MKKEFIKIYNHIYDNPKNKDGTEKEKELLGEFNIIYGNINDYAFSAIGISKENDLPYNIIGDEISGLYNPTRGGTSCRIVKINLEKEHWV